MYLIHLVRQIYGTKVRTKWGLSVFSILILPSSHLATVEQKEIIAMTTEILPTAIPV